MRVVAEGDAETRLAACGGRRDFVRSLHARRDVLDGCELLLVLIYVCGEFSLKERALGVAVGGDPFEFHLTRCAVVGRREGGGNLRALFVGERHLDGFNGNKAIAGC